MLGDEWSGGWMSFDDHVTFQPRTTKLFLLAHVKQGLTVFSQNHDIVKTATGSFPWCSEPSREAVAGRLKSN